jgi:DNA-nicking Smr family endonuclease
MPDDDKPDNDTSLFHQAVSGVRPIKQDRKPPTAKKPKPIPRKTIEDNQAVMQSLLSDEWEPGEVESGEELSFSRPGLQHSTFKKLRTGKFVVEGELDLHGQTVVEAREHVAGFIQEAQKRGLRCVRIIHGKGLTSPNKLPVLKNKVNNWLQQKDEVMAFCSAQPVDGGTGAVYVLLKKK